MLSKSISSARHFKHYKAIKQFSSLKYEWVTLPIPKAKLENSFKTRIMSYNILADCNIFAQLYPKVDPGHLQWKYRQPMLINQIRELDPDIACIQEFQPSISQDMYAFMVGRTYQFDFKGKTGTKAEGCLMFWKDSLFEMVNSFHVDMNFLDRIKELSFMDKDNIAQIVVLRSKLTGEVFIIANTHLIYNMRRGELKLGQILILFKSLNEVITLCDKKGYKNKNIFICGDFNSIPNSLIYNLFSEPNFTLFDIPSGQVSNQYYAKFLNTADDLKHYTETTRKFSVPAIKTQSKFPVLEPDFIDTLQQVKATMLKESYGFNFAISEQIEKKAKSGRAFSRADFGIEHTFFQSSYSYINKEYYNWRPHDTTTNVNKMISKIKQQQPGFKLENLTFESAMTHISSDFKANVDYIWSSVNNTMKPYRALELLDYEQLRENRQYPNTENPSDHIPLVVDFYKES